jgi:hypothetical protein
VPPEASERQKPRDRDNVSGDLLEEYRESVLPTRGPPRADLWYVTQMLRFMARGAGLWAALSGAAFIARTAMDWLAPTVDCRARSMASTWLGIGILLLAGYAAAGAPGRSPLAPSSAWPRQPSVRPSASSAPLPYLFVMVVPGAALGTVGGVAGAIVRRLRAA